MPKPKSSTIGIGKKLLFLAASLVISLLLAEGFTRIYLHLTREILPTACRQKDPLLHHSLVPNSRCRFKTKEWDITFSVNSLGMRDQEYSPAKPQGAYRILLLGDSFAEGYGVEENQTYQAILERQLNAAFSQPIEILNTGVRGYSPHLEYLYLLSRGLDLQPDLVILALDITDFSDEQRYQAFADTITQTEAKIVAGLQPPSQATSSDQWIRAPLFAQPIPTVTWLPFIPVEVKWWLHDHSRLYDLAIKTVKKRLHPEIFKDQIDFSPNDPNTDAFIILRPLSQSQYRQLWQLPQQYLFKIKSLLDQRQIPLILTIHPHGHQLSEKEWSQGRNRWSFQSRKVYSLKPQQDLKQFALQHNFTYADVIPGFQAAAAGSRQLFFTFDGHFTPAGHQVMAQQLFDFLQREEFGLE